MGDVVRRGSKDRPRFYIRFLDVDGERRQRAAKGATTLAEARRVLAAIELRVTQGKVGIEEVQQLSPEEQQRTSITVKELCEKFLAEYRSPKLKDPSRYTREARSILSVRVWPHLGNRLAGSVGHLDVERMRDLLTAQETKSGDPQLSPRSVAMALAVLSKVYNWARRAGHVACANPVAGCDRPQSQPSLDYLSKIEVAQLMTWTEAQAPNLHPMIATAVFTGLRKGELFGLRWQDIHLEAGRLDVMRSYRLLPKSGKVRHLPIHPELARILRGWSERCPASAEGLVFPVNGRMGDRYEGLGLDEALEAAKCHVPSKPWHALRHTFASHFMMAGGNILTLQKLLGHSSVAMTMVYAHLAPDFMAGEVARMSFAVTPAGVTDLGSARRSA